MADVLDKIRKLVALTASPNENEARSAAFLACKLIRENQVQLNLSGPVPRIDPISYTPYPPPRRPPPPRKKKFIDDDADFSFHPNAADASFDFDQFLRDLANDPVAPNEVRKPKS